MQPAQESRKPPRRRPTQTSSLLGIAATVPPWDELFIASELGDVDRPRATPMLLENHIGQDAWCQNYRRDEKNNRPDRHPQFTPRQDELDKKGTGHRGHQQRRNPQAEITHLYQRRIITQRKSIVIGGLDCMKMPGDAQIEFGIETKEQASHYGYREHTNEARPIH